MNLKYLELPLSEFVRLFPDSDSLIPSEIDRSDKYYIVRFDPNFCRLEIGYVSDNWILK